MHIFHWIWSAIIGLVVGLIARAILPGSDSMGLFMTMILGIAGSLLGGFIGNLIKKPAGGARFHASGFLMSLIGAIVLLVLWRFIS
jgi:uncharacterized membrane protein YeaQ/YmgE (transglycosylase-associated protein family)